MHPNTDPRQAIARELSNYYHELSGAEPKDPPRFSLSRALREMATERGLTDGFEKEIAGAAAILAGERHDPHRCWFPLHALSTRDLTASNDGGYIVGARVPSAVDVLRPFSTVVSAGIQVLPGLRESLSVPKVTTEIAGGWVASDGTTQYSEGQPSLGAVSMSPKIVATLVDFSSQFNRQVEQLEGFLRQQLFGKVGALVDAAFLAGSGNLGQPQGLVNASGVGTQAGASLDYADLVAMQSTALTAGAREDALRWIAPPAVQALLHARERVANGGRHLWDNGTVMGRPAHATPYAPAATLIAGDFSQAVMGVWGPGLKIEVDPYSGFATGKLTARVVLTCDFAFPQAGAFVVATSVS